jgi:hypothetical protein
LETNLTATNFSEMEVEDRPMLSHLFRDYARPLLYGRHVPRVGTPPITRAFDKGVMPARVGMEKDDNPYPRGTHAFGDWRAGYQASLDIAEAMDID